MVAFFYNPEIRVAQAKLDAARAAIVTAAARPNPSIGLGPAYTASEAPSFAPWAIGAVEINFPIETAGRRGYRIAKAEHLADATALGVAQVTWQIRSAVRASLVSHVAAEREYELARAYESTSARIVTLLQERVDAGESSAPELNLALANLSAARVKASQAQSRVMATLGALAASVGVPVEVLTGTVISWPGFDRPAKETSLTPEYIQQLALLNRVDLRRMLAQYAAADEALKLEIARQYPNINLGGGYSWEVNENIFELVPVITLPLMNQNQGPIAEAEAKRAQLAAEFAALQDRVIAQAQGALTSFRGALRAFHQSSNAADFSEKRLREIQRAAELNDIDALALVTAGLQTIAAQQLRSRALESAQMDLGSLEDAIERPLGNENLKSITLPNHSGT